MFYLLVLGSGFPVHPRRRRRRRPFIHIALIYTMFFYCPTTTSHLRLKKKSAKNLVGLKNSNSIMCNSSKPFDA